MSAPITEAHIDLVQTIWAGLHSQDMTFTPCAQLIADSEARAVAQWSGGLDQSLPDLYEAAKAERDQLRALVGTIRSQLNLTVRNVSDITPEEHSHETGAAIDALRAEVERLGRATTNGQVNWMQESDRQNARAERAEAELAAEREKVRTLRNAMKYLLNDDNYIDPQFDPCALASKAFEVTRDTK